MAHLAIPSAVSLLEVAIDRKKACGQRFPSKAGVGSSDVFRYVPCACDSFDSESLPLMFAVLSPPVPKRCCWPTHGCEPLIG